MTKNRAKAVIFQGKGVTYDFNELPFCLYLASTLELIMDKHQLAKLLGNGYSEPECIWENIKILPSLKSYISGTMPAEGFFEEVKNSYPWTLVPRMEFDEFMLHWNMCVRPNKKAEDILVRIKLSETLLVAKINYHHWQKIRHSVDERFKHKILSWETKSRSYKSMFQYALAQITAAPLEVIFIGTHPLLTTAMDCGMIPCNINSPNIEYYLEHLGVI